MSTENPIAHACRLLRETAKELQQAHTRGDRDDWAGEPEAKAAFDEYMAVAEALGALASAAAPAEQPGEIENLRKALEFYAEGHHFIPADETAWDTVSGEPQNFLCDEAGTATVEDGSFAKMVLDGLPFPEGDPEDATAPQPNTAYAELPECDASTVGLGEVWNRHSMRAFADATHALRASRGQAPAAGAVAGPTREQTDAAYAVLWPDSKCNPTLEERRRITLRKALTAAFAAAPTAPAQAAPSVLEDAALPQAARDVLAERQRQISTEGWTPEHDDEHVNDEIAAMACYYVMPPGAREWSGPDGYGATLGEAIRPEGWDAKDCDRRRELVKGAALALAELERIDRAALTAQKGGA